MEFETVDHNGTQISFCFTIAYLGSGNQIIGKIFLIDFYLLLLDTKLAVTKFWNGYITYIINNSIKYIFVLNLGNFDGYFIYKGLS
jgi:hypothetical protein